MSQTVTHKRQSKINWKLSIAKNDDGLRLTIISKKMGLMAMKLNAKYEDLENNGEFISGEFSRLNRALNYYYNDIPTIVTNHIPNLQFLAQNDDLLEVEIHNVFTDPEIQEWIDLFQVYVKLMKKYIRRFDLIE